MLSFRGCEIDWFDVRGYGRVCETILTASPRGFEIPRDETVGGVSSSCDNQKKLGRMPSGLFTCHIDAMVQP